MKPGEKTQLEETHQIATLAPARKQTPRAATEDKSQGQAGGMPRRLADSIVEDVNVWVNVLDAEINVVVWNKVAEEISGYSRQEVLGNNKIWDWLYPDRAYCNSVVATVSALMDNKEGVLENFETRIRRKDGEYRTILWNSRSQVGETGTVNGAITFGYDITDRKRNEEAIQKAHSEISALYHVSSVASASLDLDTILERSLDCVLATMESDMGFIHLQDEVEETLRLAARQGLPPDIIAQIGSVEPGHGLVGWVFEQGKPLMTPNLANSSAFEALCPDFLHAYLGVPMQAKGKVLGVFSVLGEVGHRFHEGEMTLLASIADQVGVAVEHARLYQQAEQLAVMQERERLSRDLHDSVTQSLYSLTLFAEAGRRMIRAGDLDRADNYLGRTGKNAQDALKEMRLLVYSLRPPALEREGLVGAIQERLGAVERRSGVKAHLLVSDMIELPEAVEEGLYRIAQEALNNALKHAMANSVEVRVDAQCGRVKMDVVDNGIGFVPSANVRRSGMGLANMRERARKLGGALQVFSEPGEGTRVSVMVDALQCSQGSDGEP